METHSVAAAGGLLIKFVAKIESCIRRRSSRRKRIIPSGRRQHRRRFSLSISRSRAADPVPRITITRIAAAPAAAAQFVSIKGCTASKWPLVTFIMRCLVRWCALVGILLHTVGALPAGLYAPGKLISCSCATRRRQAAALHGFLLSLMNLYILFFSGLYSSIF